MTPLEKAARAACEIDGGDWGMQGCDDKMREAIRAEYLAQARAVLMAVREPGVSEWSVIGETECRSVGEIRSAFTAMIDAILNEPRALSPCNQNGVVQG